MIRDWTEVAAKLRLDADARLPSVADPVQTSTGTNLMPRRTGSVPASATGAILNFATGFLHHHGESGRAETPARRPPHAAA